MDWQGYAKGWEISNVHFAFNGKPQILHVLKKTLYSNMYLPYEVTIPTKYNLSRKLVFRGIINFIISCNINF